MLRSFITLCAVFLLSAGAALAAPEIGKPAPDFTATDQDGKSVKLSDFKGKIVVLEWNNPECPFVVKHYSSGNMQKLQAYARGNKAVWLTVNSSAAGREGSLTADQAKAMLKEKNMSVDHYLIDPEGMVGKLYEAKATPHMFVIDAAGNVAYMGAIDDKASTDVKDIEGASNYVRAALDSLMASKPITLASTQAYGCSVKYKN